MFKGLIGKSQKSSRFTLVPSPSHISWQFCENMFIRFAVMLLIDRQTKEQRWKHNPSAYGGVDIHRRGAKLRYFTGIFKAFFVWMKSHWRFFLRVQLSVGLCCTRFYFLLKYINTAVLHDDLLPHETKYKPWCTNHNNRQCAVQHLEIWNINQFARAQQVTYGKTSITDIAWRFW